MAARAGVELDLSGEALAYAAMGLAVTPLHHPTGDWQVPCSCQRPSCRHVGAHPLLPDWEAAAVSDPALVSALWKEHPQANIGVLTGLAFDALQVEGEVGELGFKLLMRSGQPLGPVAVTGAGQWLFLVAPIGVRDTVLPATASRNAVRWHGRGGYLVAPPSRGPSGEPGRWLRPLRLGSLPVAGPIFEVLRGGPSPLP